MLFDLEEERIYQFLLEKKCRIAALQYPEGLVKEAQYLAQRIEERTPAQVILIGDTCYGACDLPLDVRALGAEALIHLGHAPIPSIILPETPILFVECRVRLDVSKAVEKALPLLGERVGLISTVQYLNTLSQASEILSNAGKRVLLGNAGGRCIYPGQILGCCLFGAKSIEEKVDSFLYIGDGKFHPLGVALATKKEVVAANPLTSEVYSLDDEKEKMLRRRYAAIETAQRAKNIGIIIGRKIGQRRTALAKRIKKLLEERGRKAYLIAVDVLREEHLIGLEMDAYVCTACPRIALDDALRYEKPILTPVELEIMLGMRPWEDYTVDEM